MLSRKPSRGALLVALLLGAVQPSWAAAVQVGRSDAGLTISASGAPLEDVLQALADQEGFTFSMQRDVERSPVDVDVRDASLDNALRRILRHRNYAIAYTEGADGLEVSRVEVLLPRPPKETPEAAQLRRAQEAAKAAGERNELRRRQAAERRFELLRERQSGQQQAAVEVVPYRRLPWGTSR